MIGFREQYTGLLWKFIKISIFDCIDAHFFSHWLDVDVFFHFFFFSIQIRQLAQETNIHLNRIYLKSKKPLKSVAGIKKYKTSKKKNLFLFVRKSVFWY
jgi:hypothetical protein